MRPARTAWAAGAAAVAALGALWAGCRAKAVPHPVEITLPQEDIFFRPSSLPGYTYASAYCVVCHSADYIQYQAPADPPVFWRTEVLKMRKAYGAVVPDANVDAIVGYLAAAYGAPAQPGSAAQRRAFSLPGVLSDIISQSN